MNLDIELLSWEHKIVIQKYKIAFFNKSSYIYDERLVENGD